ncbi:hypothetical protein [Syntrophomonas wolfei]|jgi:hypothetical protein|uniref:hypothetical protein n=1 Tax=Syntrophomonas wolfei TaxID=863 RepID=UPI0023F294DE|nr:hypothetical protein [Syntrophomonas wolfei]
MVFLALLMMSTVPGCGEENANINREKQNAAVEVNNPKENATSIIFNVLKVANKTESEVSSLLGQPTSTEDGKWRYSGTQEWIPNCPTNTYKDGTEIKFIDSKAARITIIPSTPVKYQEDPSILSQLGINPIPEDIDWDNGPNSIVYGNIPDLYEISVFTKDNNTVDYIYIITDELYK